MKNSIKKFLLAAAVVVAPAGASALTVTGDITGASTCSAAGGSTAYQVDVVVGSTLNVNAQFAGNEGAGTTCFDIVNTSLTDIVVSLVGVTLNQFGTFAAGGGWGWLGGIAIDTDNGGVTTHTAFAEGVLAVDSYSFLIEADNFVLFDFTYGAAYGTPEFDFIVSATVVPLPAAGFLLLGALGGLGFVGRRRRKAA